VSAAARAEALPLPLRITGIAVAALVLTGFFAYLRFPYDRLADSISARLAADAGLRVEIGRLGPSPQLLGPGLVAEDVRIARPDGSVLQVDLLRVRPAWSLAWLMARPALHLRAESPVATLEGVILLREPRHFTGDLTEVDLAEVLGATALAGARLEGRARFEVDVAFEPAGFNGPLQIAARDGVLSHPQLPMAVPYEELNGSLKLGGDAWLEIQSLDLRSPLGTGTLKGTIGHAPDPAQAPLQLEIAIEVAREIHGSLAAQGVRVGRDGQLHYRVLGTASAPIVR
jgi:type II secretion system protein N